jgi:hypothetical protein
MIVCSVVSSAAAALKPLLWSNTLPGWVLVTASHIPRCITSVMLHVSKALAAFALQRPLWGVERLYHYCHSVLIKDVALSVPFGIAGLLLKELDG